MKKILFVLLICLVLCSCQPRRYDLHVHQPNENVQKIELKDFSFNSKGDILLTLTEDEIEPFMDELRTLKTYRLFGDPSSSHSYLTVVIYYNDGDRDSIGADACFHVSEKPCDTHRACKYGLNYVGNAEMREFFSHYVSKELLPPADHRDRDEWKQRRDDSLA